MELKYFRQNKNPEALDFEIVERKGKGHPDTLADHLAEKLSVAYSLYTQNLTGLVLRHQFDKLSLMGGRCNVRFGEGNFTSPIRLLLNGRVTPTFGSKKIDFKDLLLYQCELFLEQELRNFVFSKDCKVLFEVTSNSTRGLTDNAGSAAINYRFNPRTGEDLPEYTRPLSNDTALGYGYAPFSSLERLILEIEESLTSNENLFRHPWIGTDIKIMGCRINEKVDITLAVPQICTEVSSLSEYQSNTNILLQQLKPIVEKYKNLDVRLFVNPSDNPSKELLYLRYTGSCIESGDEGVVGRGNRIGGVISARRAYSIEGLNGKNPSYHAGKVYSALAWEIAYDIWKHTGEHCEVFIISQIDRPLDDPWKIIINCSQDIDQQFLKEIACRHLSHIKMITNNFLQCKYLLA